MWRPGHAASICTITLLALPAGSLAAQGGAVELAPVVGVYVPLQSVIVQGGGTSAKQGTGLVLGGRISAGTGGKVAFDGSVAYVASDVNASAGATGGSAGLVLIDARAVILFGQAGARTGFYAAGGPAVIIRNGEFYQAFEGTTDIGGTVAVGLRFELGKVVGRVEVGSYLYSVNLTGAGSLETGAEFQADMVATASVAIPLGP